MDKKPKPKPKKRTKQPQAAAADSCWFRTDGQCLLDELLDRQSELEKSHQHLCAIVKRTHEQGEQNAQKLDAVLAALREVSRAEGKRATD